VILGVSAVLGQAACTSTSNPSAPSAFGSSVDATDGDAGRPVVSMAGTIRRINFDQQSFELVPRGDRPAIRTIRMNDRTAVFAGDRRARPRVLANGMAVEVEGFERGDAILARRITIHRRDAR
jgi:hypothetical protein